MLIVCVFMHAFFSFVWENSLCVHHAALSMVSSNILSLSCSFLCFFVKYITQIVAHSLSPPTHVSLLPSSCVCLIVHQKYGSQCSVKHVYSLIVFFLYMYACASVQYIYILNSQLGFTSSFKMVAGCSCSPLSSHKSTSVLHCDVFIYCFYSFLHWSIQSHLELIVLVSLLTVFTLSKYRNTTLLFKHLDLLFCYKVMASNARKWNHAQPFLHLV